MVKHYVGARYVPKFASPVEWAADTSYEALTIVTFNNASYTSKVPVPPTVGNPTNNPQYWALTGNYNAQVEQYRQETETVSNSLTTEITNRKNADATLQNNIDAEATARQTADNTLQGNINSEASTRASADSNLQSQINQIIAPSGEAPSAAEVQNARIGADGVIYDTLGNAIRGQVNDLKRAIDDIYNAEVNNVLNGVAWELGFINASGANVNSTTLIRTKDYVNLSNFTKVSASVDAGYIYYFYFYDSSKTFISRITATTDAFDSLPIPNNATYLRMLVGDTSDGSADVSYASKVHVSARYALLDTLDGNAKDIFDVVNLNTPSLLDGATWSVGSISGTTGANISLTTRIRTNEFLDVSQIDKIKCTIDTGYKYAVSRYKSDKSFKDFINFSTSDATVSITSDTKFVRVVVANTSDGTADVNFAEHFACTYETPFSKMASDFFSQTAEISGIEPSAYLQVPSYFNSNLATAIATIKEKMLAIGRDGDAFAFVTDCHWNNNQKHSPALINEVLKKTSVGMVVNGGDYIYGHEATKASAYNEIYDCVQAFKFSDSRIVPFNLYGNHDNNTNNNSDSSTWLTQKELYDCLVREYESEIVFGDYNYYYFDKDSAKIRYIFLMWGNNELSVQTAWIAEVMSSLPSGYKAIVFHHGIYGLNSSNQLVIQAQFILDAFEDYKDSIICFVQGHAHTDAVYYAYNGNQVPIILTDTDSMQSIGGTAIAGTVSEQCIDVVIINTSTQKINCVRIGRGSDREISY